MQPVEVMAPGSTARRHPTPQQRAKVQMWMRQSVREFTALEVSETRRMLPLLEKAQIELATKLGDWIHTAPNGELRFSAWKYRSALVHLHAMVTSLGHDMNGVLEAGGAKAQKLAMGHMVHEVSRLSEIFGDQPPSLQLNLAAILARGHASLVPGFRSAAARYAGGVWKDLNERMAIEILKGSSVSEMIDALQRDGGPRGLVALQGVAGEEGAVVKEIPEGLFARYRSRAETYVRTELAGAYARQMADGLHDARNTLPDLQRRWCTDGSACPNICAPMDGQVVGLDEPFIDGTGEPLDDQPAHPRCRCRVGAWRAHWGQLLDSLGLN